MVIVNCINSLYLPGNQHNIAFKLNALVNKLNANLSWQ